jgi:hypothetical protein
MTIAPDGRVVIAYRDATGMHAQERLPGGAFGPVRDLDTGADLPPALATDPQGRSVFCWPEASTTRTRVLMPDGTLTALQPLHLPITGLNECDLDVDADGDATYVWRHFNGMDNDLRTIRRSAAGSLSTIRELAPDSMGDTENPTAGHVAVDDEGDAVFVWTLQDSADPGIQTQRRLAGADGLSPASPLDVATGTGLFEAQVATDADGDSVIAWRGAGIQAKRMSSAGTLDPSPITVAPPGTGSMTVVMTAAGTARFVYVENIGGVNTPITRTMAPDGSLTAPVPLAPPGAVGFVPALAVAASGDGVAAWNQQGNPDQAGARAIGPGGELSEVLAFSVGGVDTNARAVAADSQGHAAVIGGSGAGSALAFYDPVPPRIDAVAVPATVERGIDANFSTSGSDVGGGLTGGWTFGDGASATGLTATHAFARSGRYPVELRLTDAAGNSTTEQRTVVVDDTIDPRFLAASMRPRRIRALARRRTRGAAKRTATIRYRLSEDARVRLVVQRRVGKRWRRAGKALVRNGKAGANRIRFSARLGKRKLAPGRYRIRLGATDPDGNKGSPRTLQFRVVRR